MLSVLRDVATIADRHTTRTRVINLSILAGGICVEGTDYVVREGMDCPLLLKSEDHISWTVLDIRGVDAIEDEIARAVARLDRAIAIA